MNNYRSTSINSKKDNKHTLMHAIPIYEYLLCSSIDKILLLTAAEIKREVPGKIISYTNIKEINESQFTKQISDEGVLHHFFNRSIRHLGWAHVVAVGPRGRNGPRRTWPSSAQTIIFQFAYFFMN